MRIALALAIAALPLLGAPMLAHAADSGEDRYGPPAPRRAIVNYPTPAEAAREEAATATAASSYNGPYLHWSGKPRLREAVAEPTRPEAPAAPAQPRPPSPRAAPPIQTPASQPPRPEALPSSLYGQAAPAPVVQPPPHPQYRAAAQPTPSLPRRAEMQPAEALPAPRPQATASAQPQSVPAAAPAVQMREPWRNLHAVTSTAAASSNAQAQSSPPAPRVAAAAPAPTSAAGPAPHAPAAPTVQTSAAPAQLATAETPAAPVRARFYSLHRDYGDAPDPVTLPPARPMVLIGPNQLATAPTGAVGSGGAGDADGASGDGQAQSASAQAAANAVKPKAPTTGTVY